MMIDRNDIEKTLSQRLSTDFDNTEITQLAELIASLTEQGIRIDDVFPYGIPTIQDAVSIRGNLDAAQLAHLATLIPTLGMIKDYRIFPRGIVAPEGFRMHLNVMRNATR